MGGSDPGCYRASEEAQRRDPRRADAAVRCQGRRHQRLFPRSGRLADGIHVVSGALSMADALHDPNVLPDDLPVPQDDGAAQHLTGFRLPDVTLAATDAALVNLSKLKGRTIVYVYPPTGRPGQAAPTGRAA